VRTHRKVSRVALTVFSKKAAYKSEKGYAKKGITSNQSGFISSHVNSLLQFKSIGKSQIEF
jgi:hypothetical protein